MVSRAFKPSKQSMVMRQQFPLALAEALTVHRSQGATLQGNVVVHIASSSGRRMDRELLYVALFRATAIENIYIVGTFRAPSPPAPTDKKIIDMERLQKESNIVLTLPNIPSLKTNRNEMVVVTWNVQLTAAYVLILIHGSQKKTKFQ
ncbi:ATP-dependent DNA helicase pfh1 [Biomphalaria pfeifferi]|uniref:ATP-dependent DNA helicase pfh1 n=1 Tax=Biomphalaria pfeifferi TaxID=112525 RepID=A0AAD8B7X5_BIOPF|nr:ATP-dependent DNA helicase pfh1 [Biomphalaria pfeifferi]